MYPWQLNVTLLKHGSRHFDKTYSAEQIVHCHPRQIRLRIFLLTSALSPQIWFSDWSILYSHAALKKNQILRKISKIKYFRKANKARAIKRKWQLIGNKICYFWFWPRAIGCQSSNPWLFWTWKADTLSMLSSPIIVNPKGKIASSWENVHATSMWSFEPPLPINM